MVVEPEEVSKEEYNSRVAGWGSSTGTKIRTSIKTLTSKGKGDLAKSVRMKTRKDYGEIDRIGYSFRRHGIFLHKGVGRGYHMENGVVVRGARPGKVLTAANMNANYRLHQQVLRSARINRKPVIWLNPVIDDNIEQLAEMVTEMRANNVINATRIRLT